MHFQFFEIHFADAQALKSKHGSAFRKRSTAFTIVKIGYSAYTPPGIIFISTLAFPGAGRLYNRPEREPDSQD
jgi:hypothetical protein